MVFNGSEAFRGEGPILDRGIAVTSSENKVILDSKELNAASGPFNLCCAEAYARFSDLKRLRIHPGKMTKERDAVESCSADVYNGIQKLCLVEFDAVKSCLNDNPTAWALCAAARRDLDVCSVRNGLGEIQK